ncbi:TPA: hypothetical protein N0F65_000939 [Lagenidium giganteum]|uniref:Uncharacterized protein n=1 Tax=Lagenidium giganteum TaxID=4803 RepID=A0AAV2YMV1_9STRA|nr:TPA: hypothetical protein N0F65_000939 [Lagenidium giganteum]
MLSMLRKVTATAGAQAQRRTMASHSHAHGKNYPFGMHFHVSSVHKNLGIAYGTMLWLWVFWRAKQDGKVVLGLEHPWDHHHGGHDSHGHALSHGHGVYRYEKTEVGALPTLVRDEDDE